MFEAHDAPHATDDGRTRQHVLLPRRLVFWHSELIGPHRSKLIPAHCQRRQRAFFFARDCAAGKLSSQENREIILANLKVILLRYCKTENGWRRFPVVTGKTGKVKPSTVLVDGNSASTPRVITASGSTRDRFLYKNVGTDPGDPLLAQQKQEALPAAMLRANSRSASALFPTCPGLRTCLRSRPRRC